MCQQSFYSFVQKYELKKKKTWFQHTQETKFLFFKYYLREEFKAKKNKKIVKTCKIVTGSKQPVKFQSNWVVGFRVRKSDQKISYIGAFETTIYETSTLLKTDFFGAIHLWEIPPFLKFAAD